MCIEVVLFYIFPVTKEMFYISYIYFLHIRVLTFIVSFYSTISRGWNHIFHNYDTKVEKDTLINEDDAHKVFFCTFSDLLKIFYMWPNHMNLQDGKHVDV